MLTPLIEILKPDSRSWLTVRSIGNSRPVQLTVFAPFVGYLIIYNEHIYKYFSLSNIIGEGVNNPDIVFWRLFCLYLGLICLGLGSIIYQIFCPRHVSRYPSNSEFVAGEFPWLTWRILDELANKVHGVSFQEFTLDHYGIDKDKYHASEPLAQDIYKPEIDHEMNENAKKQILREYYRKLMSTKPILREACFFLFVVGIILISIPSLAIFLRICSLAFSKARYFVGV